LCSARQIATAEKRQGVNSALPLHKSRKNPPNKEKPVISDWFHGGAYRIRTGDLYNANPPRKAPMGPFQGTERNFPTIYALIFASRHFFIIYTV
jgi:hypothetical protein